MKIFISTLLFMTLSTQVLLSNELAWVDEQIEAIKPPRKGISKNTIDILDNPFIFLEVKKKQKKAKISTSKKYVKKTSSKKKIRKHYSHKLTLEAIINSSALINGKWYKKGEKVYGYVLKEVNIKSVLLTKGKKRVILSTLSKNKNLKFKNN